MEFLSHKVNCICLTIFNCIRNCQLLFSEVALFCVSISNFWDFKLHVVGNRIPHTPAQRCPNSQNSWMCFLPWQKRLWQMWLIWGSWHWKIILDYVVEQVCNHRVLYKRVIERIMMMKEERVGRERNRQKRCKLLALKMKTETMNQGMQVVSIRWKRQGNLFLLRRNTTLQTFRF